MIVAGNLTSAFEAHHVWVRGREGAEDEKEGNKVEGNSQLNQQWMMIECGGCQIRNIKTFTTHSQTPAAAARKVP